MNMWVVYAMQVDLARSGSGLVCVTDSHASGLYESASTTAAGGGMAKHCQPTTTNPAAQPFFEFEAP